MPPSFREDLRCAVRLFIENAYDADPPSSALRYLPPQDDAGVNALLMGDLVERLPPAAPFDAVKTFNLRIGCRHYRHLKLRISRIGPQATFVFMVDSHDSFLVVEPESPDFAGLQELKRRNADLVASIASAWESAGVTTERNFMREMIRQAKDRLEGRDLRPPEPGGP